jgi:hypothetical protein
MAPAVVDGRIQIGGTPSIFKVTSPMAALGNEGRKIRRRAHTADSAITLLTPVIRDAQP